MKRGKRVMFIPQFFKVPSVQVLTKERERERERRNTVQKKKKRSKFSVPHRFYLLT